VSRVLLVWPYAPWPSVTGTARRLARLTEELTRDAEVAMVLTGPADLASAPVPVLHRVESPRSRGQNLLGMLHAVEVGEPLFTGFFHRGDARRGLHTAVDEWQPDMVWVHGLAGDTIARGVVPDEKTVLDLSDAEHERFRRLAGATGGARGVLWRIDSRRVASWAGRRLPQLRATTVVSDADKASYQGLAPAARVIVVPNGVDAKAQPRPDPGEKSLLFLGDLGYPPNAEGLRWFVDHVLPRARQVERLLVVGRGVPPQAAKVEATGFVADLDDAWRQVAAMVVPLRSGGGTRLKVLDAMGAGVPVISTRFGVDGLGAQPGEHYVLAESAEEFLGAIGQVLDDPELRRRVGSAGRDLVATRFAWRQCLEPALPVLLGEDLA
jgi:glycosyltransferase involved in cell wall biosynthesis